MAFQDVMGNEDQKRPFSHGLLDPLNQLIIVYCCNCIDLYYYNTLRLNLCARNHLCYPKGRQW